MASKVNIRKGHRAYVTKSLQELADELLKNDDDQDVFVFQSLLTTLKEKLVRLEELDDEVLGTLCDHGGNQFFE